MLISFEYLFRQYNIQTPGVLHLGANTGQEAETYHKHGVPCVIWVEALPGLIPQLVKNVRRFPGWTVLQACLSDKDGEPVTFHVASNGGQSSSILEFGTHAQEHPTVKYVSSLSMTTVRVDTLLTQNGIILGEGWFLNIDLQGAELLALRGMGKLLSHFDYAYIEVNEKELYKGCPLVKEIDNYLRQFGMTGVETKMTGSGWGDRMYIRQ